MAMVSLGQAVRTWATLKAMAAAVKDHMEAVEEEVKATLNETGAERVKVTIPWDESIVLGHVTLVEPKQQFKPVTISADQLLEWAKKNAPGYVIHVPEHVVPAHDEVAPPLLDIFEVVQNDDGAAVTIFPSTGEPVPGVGVKRAKPYLKTTWAGDGAEALMDAVRDGYYDSLIPRALDKGNDDEGSE